MANAARRRGDSAGVAGWGGCGQEATSVAGGVARYATRRSGCGKGPAHHMKREWRVKGRTRCSGTRTPRQYSPPVTSARTVLPPAVAAYVVPKGVPCGSKRAPVRAGAHPPRPGWQGQVVRRAVPRPNPPGMPWSRQAGVRALCGAVAAPGPVQRQRVPEGQEKSAPNKRWDKQALCGGGGWAWPLCVLAVRGSV